MDEKRRQEIVGWLRDVVEIIVILSVIILLSRAFLGAHMLLPLVAVTSCSMYHQGSLWNGVGCIANVERPEWIEWDAWLRNHNFSQEKINTLPFQNGFSTGDMIITVTPDGEGTLLPLFPETNLGDVVIFNRDIPHMKKHPGKDPIIHRVVGSVKVKDFRIVEIEGTLDCLTPEDFNDTFIPYIRNCIAGASCPYKEHPSSGDFNFYMTKGDNNPATDQCNNLAFPVTDSQLVARGWIRVSYVGWLKIALNMIIPFNL